MNSSLFLVKCFCLAVALASGIPGFGFAQGPAVYVRPETVRLRPPVNAKWSIRMKSIKKETGKPPDDKNIPEPSGNGDAEEVSRAEYILTGKTGRAVVRSGKGKREEIYFIKEGGNTLFLRYLEKARRVVPYLLDAYLTAEFRFAEAYPGVDWVKKEDYQSIVEFRGEICHWFALDPREDTRREETEASIAYNPRFSPDRREAWFSAKTGLPVAFRTASVEGAFRHEAPPASPVKLPKPYLEALHYYYGVGKRPEPHPAPGQ